MLRHARSQMYSRFRAFNASRQRQVVRLIGGRAFQNSCNRSRFTHHIKFANPLSAHARRPRVTAPHEMTEDDWERTTKLTLNPSSTPLGTMTENQIDNALGAINFWLSPGNYLPSAYDVQRADSLLQRLVYEYDSGTINAKSFTKTLAQANVTVLQSWLSFGSYLTALEHADTILFRLTEWYRRGLLEDVSPDYFHTLAKLWLDQNTIETTSHVADLLLWWTSDPEAPWVSPLDITPLFHEALQHVKAANDKKVVKSLLDRMEELQTKWGWEGISSWDDIEMPRTETKSTTNVGYIDSNLENGRESVHGEAEVGKKKLSSFELATMRQSFLNFIETAGVDDSDKVEEWAKRWNSLPVDGEVSGDLGAGDICMALVDYFIRVQDPKKATKWLQRADQVAEGGKAIASLNKLHSILQLWANSDHRESPWRAQELVHRMEELNAQGEPHVNTSAYNMLCEAWLKSGEPVATQKVLDVLTCMINSNSSQKAPDVATCQLIQRMVTDIKSDDAAKLSDMASSVFKQQWNHTEQAELQSFLEKTTEAMCHRGMVKQASSLIRQAIRQKMTIAPAICENVLKAHMNARQARAAVEALDYFEEMERKSQLVSLSFGCYEMTLASLLESGLKGSSEKEKEILSRLLDRTQKGEVAVQPATDFNRFLSWILYKMKKQRRAYDSQRMLQLMESKLLGGNSPITIPVDCFNHVLQALAQAGAVNEVEEVFTRLLGYSTSHSKQLMPNTATFGIYLSFVTRDRKRESAEKAEKVLGGMIDFFETSGKDECKPDEGIFNAVLIAWKNNASEQAVTRSMALLEQMLGLGILPETFTFNTIMTTVNRSRRDNSYSMVVELMNRMAEVGLKPNSHTYNALLNACAHAQNVERESALAKAVESMGHLRKLGVDEATYPTFLKVLRHLLRRDDDRRDKLVRSAFRLCCEDGFLTPSLEDQFRKLLSRVVWESAYSDKDRNGTIPRDWSRNVKHRTSRW